MGILEQEKYLTWKCLLPFVTTYEQSLARKSSFQTIIALFLGRFALLVTETDFVLGRMGILRPRHRISKQLLAGNECNVYYSKLRSLECIPPSKVACIA